MCVPACVYSRALIGRHLCAQVIPCFCHFLLQEIPAGGIDEDYFLLERWSLSHGLVAPGGYFQQVCSYEVTFFLPCPLWEF